MREVLPQHQPQVVKLMFFPFDRQFLGRGVELKLDVAAFEEAVLDHFGVGEEHAGLDACKLILRVLFGRSMEPLRLIFLFCPIFIDIHKLPSLLLLFFLVVIEFVFVQVRERLADRFLLLFLHTRVLPTCFFSWVFSLNVSL
jgi:hypothetical protein